MTSSPSVPPLPRDQLRGFERLAVPLVETIHAFPGLREATRPLWRYGGKNFVGLLSSRLYHVHGLSHVTSLDAPAGVVLCCNHRSFFDLFFVTTVVIDAAPRLVGRPVFPVRKDYFYDHPFGLAINMLLSTGSMWPPVFRDERRGALNPIAMAQIGAIMQRGTFVGIHPEGRRGHGPDPYALGRIRPGVGHLLAAASPEVIVLPAWTLGADNDFLGTVRRNWQPAGRRGEPVRIWFGEPLRGGDLVASHGGDPQRMAESIMEHVARLGELDRAWRRDHPGPC